MNNFIERMISLRKKNEEKNGNFKTNKSFFERFSKKKTNKMGRSQTMNKKNEKAKCANLKVWITNFLNK